MRCPPLPSVSLVTTACHPFPPNRFFVRALSITPYPSPFPHAFSFFPLAAPHTPSEHPPLPPPPLGTTLTPCHFMRGDTHASVALSLQESPRPAAFRQLCQPTARHMVAPPAASLPTRLSPPPTVSLPWFRLLVLHSHCMRRRHLLAIAAIVVVIPPSLSCPLRFIAYAGRPSLPVPVPSRPRLPRALCTRPMSLLLCQCPLCPLPSCLPCLRHRLLPLGAPPVYSLSPVKSDALSLSAPVTPSRSPFLSVTSGNPRRHFPFPPAVTVGLPPPLSLLPIPPSGTGNIEPPWMKLDSLLCAPDLLTTSYFFLALSPRPCSIPSRSRTGGPWNHWNQLSQRPSHQSQGWIIFLTPGCRRESY
ncbi:hypothetical protein EDB84DRAFT_170729 [Lactarius hengduanensis]|nr:hypothetical protein EDB84DRAFT_170729 [Lactarius hengduanensis]